MIITDLLNHQYKEKIRSQIWQRSVWLNILLAIVWLYMTLCVLSIGYFADDILMSVYKGRNVIELFTGFLFYYFAFDLMMRFLFQKVPVISMQPYLTLPIKKSTLLNYPLLKTIPGIFNILALCLILPFYFKTVLPAKPVLWSTLWLLTVVSILITNNFTGFFLKKYFAKRPLLIFLVLALIGVIFLLDARGRINVMHSMVTAFLFLKEHPYFGVIPPLVALLSYRLAYLTLKRNSYVEERGKRKLAVSPDFSFLSRYGEIGLLIQTELRMIFRNKRSKSIIWLSIIFLFYGFIFYNPDSIKKGFFLLFGGFFITSSSGLLYGQYYFAWESSFLDVYLANRVTPLNYLKSKFWLFFSLSTICYLLTLPYGLFGHNIFLINFSMFLYNIGVTSFLYILFGIFSRSRIDLGKSQFMNYEGTGAAQWLSMIPVMGLPLLIYLICHLAGNANICYFILAVMGITGILFSEHILNILVKVFLRNKYKMSEAFRKK